RPLESRMSSLELQLENQPPAPEPRLAAMERKLREGQEEHSRQLRSFEERCESLETAVNRVSSSLPRLSSEIMSDWESMSAERFEASARASKELQRLSQRCEQLPESMERCMEELALYRQRLESLPSDEVATAQQLKRLSEDVGALKLVMVKDTEAVELRCTQKLRSLEDVIKNISWDLDGAEKQLKELANQFASVNQMQLHMQNLDGQMEIVTGLIHRMDAMGRFLQHIQNGMRGEV
ncbi:unnamed protein product, partial [Durusdinium trenchii]